MASSRQESSLPGGFSVLPLELFLNILDQLVGTGGQQPIAYANSNAITKSLRTLTLVSRTAYLVASRYLYSNCLYLHNCTNFARLRRTLGLGLGNHPQAIHDGQLGRNDRLFEQAQIPKYITSMFLSPMHEDKDGNNMPMVPLPEVIDLCKSIGATLRRLALDLQPVFVSRSYIHSQSHENGMFLYMPRLEELIVSFDVLDYFRFPPPNLKRLAITAQGLTEVHEDFYRSMPMLQTLVFLRPLVLTATDINRWMNIHTGKGLDIILVDVSANHATPTRTRSWSNGDTVRIWEVDVPTSFYGDDDDLILCDHWIWAQGFSGTLWTTDKRRMASWADIEKRLAGPVHSIMDNVSS